MKQYILALVLAVVSASVAFAVNPIKEGNMISGHVIVKGTEENIPYATVLIIGSGQGTVSNEEGQFEFRKLPAGKYKLRVSAVGYKTQEKEVTVSKDFTAVIHFPMEEESFMTDEVVVSANRNEVSRKAAPVVVNVMSTKLFEMVNSTDLAKTLNYQSGLRVENNCQNCGFPQVRINGLEGIVDGVFGYNIDSSSHSIGAKQGRASATHHFYPFNHVHGDLRHRFAHSAFNIPIQIIERHIQNL